MENDAVSSMGKTDQVYTDHPFVLALNHTNSRLDALGSLLSKFVESQQANIQSVQAKLKPNNDLTVNLTTISMYVDNSSNGSPVTIQRVGGGGVSYTVPANTQQWIPMLGGREFTHNATQVVPVLCVNQLIPIK